MIGEWLAGLTRRAQTMTEYALILAAVAIVANVGYVALGAAVTTLIESVVKCL